MAIEIRSANLPEDAPVVGDLFRGYLNFLFERVPEDRENTIQKYDPARIPELVQEFARIHARPKGLILIARLGNDWVGCAMLRQREPGIAEIQRVFVSEKARGHGLGKALTKALIEHARANAYTHIRLDTGRPLTEAIGLYKSLGFQERTAYHADTPQLAHLLVFFELEL
jgi:ribosomal protein S18 acetylase RimI-like enzyme